MKSLFAESIDRYVPDRERGEVDVKTYRIEAQYDADMQVARLVIASPGTTARGVPVHASSSVSAAKQMIAAYENAVEALTGYPDYDLAHAALTCCTGDLRTGLIEDAHQAWVKNWEPMNVR